MSSFFRNRIVQAVSPDDVDFARRGFTLDRPVARRRLEASALAFVRGAREFAHGQSPAHTALHDFTPELRGFGYEGAGMSAALLDLLRPGRSRHLRALLGGDGYRYRHLVHVGAGWAMSVSRLRSPAIWGALDPLLRWLALDGAGFRLMFFDTGARFTTLGAAAAPSDLEQVTIQGSGRALWFVRAGDVQQITTTVENLPPVLAPHLWSGVGLAAGYAGDDPPPDARDLRAAAGAHADHLAQGVLFAAAARYNHGHVPDHTSQLLRGLLGISATEAADLADTAARDLSVPGQTVTGYLEWRRRLRNQARARLDAHAGHTPTAHAPHITGDRR